jgi:acyl-CoA thioester hydrolase
MSQKVPAVAVSMEVPVRWSDLDFLGHVNNAVFLNYLEDARDRMLAQSLGAAFEDTVIVRIEVDYRHEIARGVPYVTVAIQVLGYGRSSVQTKEVITLPDGTVAAEATATVVVRDPQTLKSRPLTDAEKSGLDRAIRGSADA